MKIYISGPMSGYEGLNFDAFNDAADYWRGKGWEVVNPAEVNPDLNADWVECIVADIVAMRDCTHIFMLDNWEQSYGAAIEKLVAEKMNMQVIFQTPKVT